MKGKFFKCECGHGGLYLEYSRAWGLEISHMTRDPLDLTWKNKLRFIWSVIKGKPYTDMVLLDNAAIANLVDYLCEIQNADHEEEEHKELIERVVGHLFGVHCMDAVEGIIAWTKTGDCSQRALDTLIKTLTEKQNGQG